MNGIALPRPGHDGAMLQATFVSTRSFAPVRQFDALHFGRPNPGQNMNRYLAEEIEATDTHLIARQTAAAMFEASILALVNV